MCDVRKCKIGIVLVVAIFLSACSAHRFSQMDRDELLHQLEGVYVDNDETEEVSIEVKRLKGELFSFTLFPTESRKQKNTRYRWTFDFSQPMQVQGDEKVGYMYTFLYPPSASTKEFCSSVTNKTYFEPVNLSIGLSETDAKSPTPTFVVTCQEEHYFISIEQLRSID